jgi:hypothetical protein
MKQHTLGKWVVGYGKTLEIDAQVFAVGVNTDPDWTPICIISTAADVNETDEANARLIAAAPDLLDALLDLLAAVEANGHEKTTDEAFASGRAAAAIFKATGGAA